MHERNDYWMRERECERIFAAGGPYFMINTEHVDWLLYKTREEFIVGTNLVAIAAAESGFHILDDVQMNNHHHVLGEGTRSRADAFADLLREKERKFQTSLGNRSLKDWEIRVDATTDLQQFRNRVAYIDRNAYVVRLDSTPNGYPWGSGGLFFNGNLWMMSEGLPWKSLTIEKKRKICRSHNIDMPDTYKTLGGMILRRSFVDYKRTESMFNSANQYFTKLTRHGEADVEISKALGEKIQLPTEEVFQIVGGWFPGSSVRELEVKDRLEAAKAMKTRLNSSNKQISQVLRLPEDQLERLFPRSR
jgi:hypothetical protein